jgi:hypothetical protein
MLRVLLALFWCVFLSYTVPLSGHVVSILVMRFVFLPFIEVHFCLVMLRAWCIVFPLSHAYYDLILFRGYYKNCLGHCKSQRFPGKPSSFFDNFSQSYFVGVDSGASLSVHCLLGCTCLFHACVVEKCVVNQTLLVSFLLNMVPYMSCWCIFGVFSFRT